MNGQETDTSSKTSNQLRDVVWVIQEKQDEQNKWFCQSNSFKVTGKYMVEQAFVNTQDMGSGYSCLDLGYR